MPTLSNDSAARPASTHAYEAGQQANEYGYRVAVNPYTSGSADHEAWLTGWNDAQIDREVWYDLCDESTAKLESAS